MSAKKFNRLMIILLAVCLCGAFAMVYFGNTIMRNSSRSLVDVKLKNVSLDIQEQNYLQARKDLEKYSELSTVIQQVLPKSKDQAQAVAELYKIGDETGILIDKVQFSSSSLGQRTSSSSTGTTASSSSVTQASPVAGMTGVLGMDVTISLQPASGKSIAYNSMIAFLQKIEVNRRNMQIKQISVSSDTKNGGVTFQLTLTIFVKP
jgi:hypothetical protein